MKPKNRLSQLLLALLVALSLIASACGTPATQAPAPTEVLVAEPAPTTAPEPTQVPEPTAVPVAELDIKDALTPFITGLPEGFYGIKGESMLQELGKSPKPFVIDLREPGEITEAGFIDGAVNIPIRDLLKNLDKLPAKDQPIFVYCGVGVRGAMATQALRMLGYTNVRSLSGGFNGWKNAQLPVVTGAPGAPVAGLAPEVDTALFGALNDWLAALPEGFYGVKSEVAVQDLGKEPKPFLLDVREAKEVADNGYLAGSVNIPIRTLVDSLGQLPADKSAPIITYCAVGHRGAMAVMTLRLLGYTNVRTIGGGFNGWVKAGLPVEGAPFSIKPALEAFITGLPEGFYGVKSEALVAELAKEPRPFLLDVREPKELAEGGFIDGAVNIPVRDVLKNLDKLPAKDQPIVTYCGVGVRGAQITEALRLLGYTNVRTLSGGINGWKNAKLPLVTGEPTAPVAGTAPEVNKDMLAALDAYMTALPEGFYGVKSEALVTELAKEPKPFLLDVRETKEVTDNGYIADSVNVPVRTLLASLDQLPADKAAPIVTYCAVGVRGSMAMMTLRLMGYSNVRTLSGGFNAWNNAKLPVVK